VSEVFLTTMAVAAGGFTLLWLISLPLRNASIVDPFWGPSFAVISWVAWAVADDPGGRGLLLAVLVSIWATRLGGYLLVRNAGKGEDFRYVAMRRRWGKRFPLVSLGTVFLLQAVLAWIVSLPVQAGIFNGGDPGIIAFIGAGIWLIGLLFESVGDWQLTRFKADPMSEGRVMDRGLWRYTRHPNYFGDFTAWWGIFVVAWTGWPMAWTAIGPITMSILLLRVSGVSLLEKTIEKRRPGYAEYAARTNAFFPWLPKDPETTGSTPQMPPQGRR
jgi:steroid 5-alpha reductase family enzyme